MASTSTPFLHPVVAQLQVIQQLLQQQVQKNETLLKENTQLRAVNRCLTEQVADLERRQLGSKKRKAGNDDNDDCDSPPSVSKKFKTPTQRKKLFEKWAKAVMRQSAKTKLTTFDGCRHYDVVIKDTAATAAWTMADFEAVFNDKGGTKIQPTKDNKPTSAITVLKWNDYHAIRMLFGDADVSIPHDAYKAQAIKKRKFEKDYRAGSWSATLKTLEVHYNKSTLSLQLKFGLVTGECYYDSDCDDL